MSYRQLANKAAEYRTCLRDRYVELHGVKLCVKMPAKLKPESDFYGDDDSVTFETHTRYVIPIYTPYYQLLEVLGTNAEADLPLELIVKVEDAWVTQSTFKLSVKNQMGCLSTRSWNVIGAEMKHLEVGYAKVIKAVPVRDDYFDDPKPVGPVTILDEGRTSVSIGGANE